ncbi:MAG: glycosyltransferase family 39 protein [Nitrospirae bacterium]|nr:glycosyltransferase family 39 protein [Nitrospirota bacterium]
MLETLREIDVSLFYLINRHLQNIIFDVSMPIITNRYYFIILILMAWLIIKNKKKALIPIVLTIISVALSDWTANILKHLIGRIRPCHALEGARMLVGCTNSFSMPSNHAANSFAIILAVSYISGKWMRWTALTVALLVGFSRVYVGVHYPSDVLVGALTGIAVSVLVIKFYEWASVRYKFKPYTTMLLISLLGLSLFRIYYITYGVIDLSPDEAHYWEWARRLDLSYYSKGPMIAYLIAFGTAIFGDNVFGIRIMAVISSAMSSIFIYLLGKKLFDERAGLAAAVLMQIVPLYSAYGVLFTIDSPFIFFWVLSLYLFWRAINPEMWNSECGMQNSNSELRTPNSELKTWLLLGISIGFGLLTKYTMAFFYICALLFLLASKQRRRILLTKEPYISLALSLIIFSPVIIWNAGHDWVTLKHTAGQAHISGQWSVVSDHWLKNFSEFLGSQIGVITPIIFVLIMYSLFKLKNKTIMPQRDTKENENVIARSGSDEAISKDEIPRYARNDRLSGLSDEYSGNFLFWFSIPIIVFFLLKSFQGKVQANWALPAYAAGFIAFSAVFISRWESIKKWIKWAVITGIFISLTITATAYYPALPLKLIPIAIAHYPDILQLLPKIDPTKLDPTARTRGWEELGVEVSRVSDRLSKKGPFFIISDKYQVSSELAFYVKGQPVTYCVNLGRRMNQYDLWPGFDTLVNFNAVFVTIDDVQMPEAVGSAFDRCEKRFFTAFSKDKKLRDYSIFTCYNFKGMLQKGINSY